MLLWKITFLKHVHLVRSKFTIFLTTNLVDFTLGFWFFHNLITRAFIISTNFVYRNPTNICNPYENQDFQNTCPAPLDQGGGRWTWKFSDHNVGWGKVRLLISLKLNNDLFFQFDTQIKHTLKKSEINDQRNWRKSCRFLPRRCKNSRVKDPRLGGLTNLCFVQD